MATTSHPSRDPPPATDTGRTHDIVVIGGSAGSLEALRQILPGLPPDLPAALFIVVHVGEVSYLADIMAGKTTLRVERARSGAIIKHGTIYVAVPGYHLLLHDDHVLLRRGPRENLSRPAIDPLFRSAAASFGTRTIGVVLSGALSDGTGGLRAIKRCGGLAVAQKVEDAVVPSMPRSAQRHVEIDHVCRAAEMGGLLARLVRQPAGPSPEVPLDIRLEAAIAAQELAGMKAEDMIGTPSRFTCPECHGALWEIEDGPMLRYRCHVGHAFAADVVLDAQGEEIERMLTSLQRAHQERAELAKRLAVQERRQNRVALANHLENRAREYEEDALLVREVMQSGIADPADGVDHGVGQGNDGEGQD